jgi:monomeric isocitrate dehydrogenase
LVTRRSQTGILGYINNSPIVAYSKRQTTVEVSTFGSEFVAMRTCVEMCEALRYKLQMFGVAIDGKIDVLCDNMSVVKNSSLPESVLSKNHTSICYHRVREAVAAGILWIAKVDSKDNLADLLTKQLSNEARGYIIACIHYDGDESVGSEVDKTSVPPGICA